MRIYGHGKETYLYLNGISVERPIMLGDQVELQPAVCSPTPESIIKVSTTEADLAVTTLFLRTVSAQIHVEADTPRKLAIIAWNTIWDTVLLSAILNTEVARNIQCDMPATDFCAESKLQVTNYHLRGLSRDDPRKNSKQESEWLAQNMPHARLLLKEPPFQNAVHCLASYRWHPLPRVGLAVLWAGIEGLFGISSELSFRLSLYLARFLCPDDGEERSRTFKAVGKLYGQRSTAVHGSKMKGDPAIALADSAILLQRALRRCVEARGLPETENLAP